MIELFSQLSYIPFIPSLSPFLRTFPLSLTFACVILAHRPNHPLSYPYNLLTEWDFWDIWERWEQRERLWLRPTGPAA